MVHRVVRLGLRYKTALIATDLLEVELAGGFGPSKFVLAQRVLRRQRVLLYHALNFHNFVCCSVAFFRLLALETCFVVRALALNAQTAALTMLVPR